MRIVDIYVTGVVIIMFWGHVVKKFGYDVSNRLFVKLFFFVLIIEAPALDATYSL